MTGIYEIHPRIGVARLGNSPDAFYLGPDSVGGLPIECDEHGNAKQDKHGKPEPVRQFKDTVGRVKRQAQKFKLFRRDSKGTHPVDLDDKDIEKIVWTVHIANKKPIWYTFSELQGNLEFGRANSYKAQHVPRNNPEITDATQRKALIIDPGPRSIDRPGATVKMSRYDIPGDYGYGSFPPTSAGGAQIDVLGELRMDKQGNLVALGAFGNVTGSAAITTFRGAGGYWDDISDGFVLATVHVRNRKTGKVETVDAVPAWLIVGSPKYAPEVVNISTLHDTAFDVAVRFMKADPKIFSGRNTRKHFPKHNGYTPLNGYNPDYKVNFTTQVKPILDRMAGYRWVADIPYLADFASPGFDLTDSSSKNAAKRKGYFGHFRVPVLPADYAKWIHKVPNGPNTLFSQDGIPLMPLNSGDNSVTNSGPIYKFETLTPTQFFFMNQWADGKFFVGDSHKPSEAEQLDEASLGNCVGAPFSPGIETTWIVRNPAIYSAPLHLKLAHFDGSNGRLATYYRQNGLSTTEDEGEGAGCEPGDLTKRMAIPWQADFQECTVQTPNITNPSVNQFADGTGIEVPPAYYVYWWPPQSPMHVVTGDLSPDGQVLDAVVSRIAEQPIIPAGQRVPYQRGIGDIADMIANWSRLGFIVNQGVEDYPYLVEQERNFGGLAQVRLNQVFAESK